MHNTILIIEDERAIHNIIRTFLADAGYTVCSAYDGMEGIEKFRDCRPDLVLLDLMLPKINGFAVCERIRKESSTPIIMLTALDDEDSQIKGFDLVTDDYITKPFSMPLVLRRIEAVLRRTDRKIDLDTVISYRDICLNTESYEVLVRGKNVQLTAREFDILRLLLENKGRVFTRDNLLNMIWGYDYFGDEKIVNTHIKNIRKKLCGDYIKTIRGVGYKIEKEN